MEFLKKDSFVSIARDQTATLMKAPTRIKLEQNKPARAVRKQPMGKTSEINSFLTLETIQKNKYSFSIKPHLNPKSTDTQIKESVQ